ncbi:DUF4352 domain-containing protein [Streptomyces sp. CB03238]|uniref:DUF4352 domain-containing protein n=1 Tax=Streptomyces sp. CB03238 TaxID=1907777 RepID=UPI001F4E7ED4|nr:DUF4352 domain-containing protein [Streptomyces sp. CB03238]
MNHQPPSGHQLYPPQPGQYAPYPPPPPKKGLGTGAIVAITLGSVFAALIVLGALVGDGEDTERKDVTSVRPAESEAKPAEKPAAPEKAEEEPVKVTAQRTEFTPSVLHDGGKYTSVSVTVTNHSGKNIDINPLYFSITDTTGSKHTAELGVDERQMDTAGLAPGEKITGVITGEGTFTPKYVTYVNGLIGDGTRGDVS